MSGIFCTFVSRIIKLYFNIQDKKIMRKKLLSLLVLLMTAVSGAWAESWPSGDCTVTLSGGVMTVSGTGAMGDDQPWSSYKSEITSVVIEDGVTSIGNYAFTGCGNLASVSIPASMTSIGPYAFSLSGTAATALTVTFAEGTSSMTIGEGAFGFANLTSITIPNSVTSIGKYAFNYCSKLETITLNSNPFIDEDAFTGIKAGATVTMNLTANSADGAYWTTFYNMNYSFQADVNTQVFKVELNDTKLTLHEVEDRIVNGGLPVVLKKSTDGNIVMTQTTEATSNTQPNSLSGVSDPAGLPADGNTYVLDNGSEGLGFYKLADGKKLGVGNAFLFYSGGAGAREFFGFGEATGIEAIDNGQLTIDNEVYDLQGRRVANPTKGIYVVNGKKVITK